MKIIFFVYIQDSLFLKMIEMEAAQLLSFGIENILGQRVMVLVHKIIMRIQIFIIYLLLKKA